MGSAIVSGLVTGDAPFSYWSIVCSVPSNSPSGNVTQPRQFPSRFLSGELKTFLIFPSFKNSQFKANSILIG